MTFTQFSNYANNVGVTFASRMALQEGVCLAQVHLWVIKVRPKDWKDIVANLA